MGKILKYWNGRGHGIYRKAHINVAAFSQKQAAELVGMACKTHISIGEIREYYSQCWGDSMDGISTSIPGVFVEEKRGQPVRKVL
jgi:hypothetical protein